MAELPKNSPKAVEAERALLGSVMVNNSVMVEVASMLSSEDFFVPKHSEIWGAMLDLFEHNKTIDLVTLSSYMKNENESSLYMSGLYESVGQSAYAKQYAEQVLSTARRRKIIIAAGRIAAAAYEEIDPSVAEEQARSILEKTLDTSVNDDLLTPPAQAGILRQYFESLKGDRSNIAIPTGFPMLDFHCGGGLRRGNLVIVAARTSIGKSTFAECVAENAAYKGSTVLFVSLEMSPNEMIYRYAVRSGKISRSGIEYGIDTPEDEAALELLTEERSELPFYLLNAPSATTTRIRSAITRMQMRGSPPDLVIVDYLQLLKDAGRTEERLRIGEITANMKALAAEFSAPIVLLSQLNRNIEMRGGEPRLSDMLESGRIEADADVVIMLWEMEKADLMGNITKAKIAKNRQGATAQLPIFFNKEQFRFGEQSSHG